MRLRSRRGPRFYRLQQKKPARCKLHLPPVGCDADRVPGLVDMHPLKTTSAALAGLAVLAMIVVQFAPWASFEQSGSTGGGSFGGFTFPGFDFSFEMVSNTWTFEVESNGESDTTSWFDGDMDDADGIGMIRAAIPLLLVGAVVVLAGALLGMARGGAIGSVVTLAGGVLLAIGTTLFAIGTGAFYDEADYSWVASFYLAIVACVLAVSGGVLGLMAGNTTSAKTAF